jgi:hypothetical protein
MNLVLIFALGHEKDARNRALKGGGGLPEAGSPPGLLGNDAGPARERADEEESAKREDLDPSRHCSGHEEETEALP